MPGIAGERGEGQDRDGGAGTGKGHRRPAPDKMPDLVASAAGKNQGEQWNEPGAPQREARQPMVPMAMEPRGALRRGASIVLEPDAQDADGSGDVLDMLVAHILQGERNLAMDLVGDNLRQADPAGRGEPLDAGRDIDAVAIDVVLDGHDVAEIDADAEIHAPVIGLGGIERRHGALDLDCAAYRIDDAGELDQQPVARRLEDAAVMLGDLGIEQGAADLGEAP